ncbi:MAG: phage portal protein [SAR202 cluster bacterium]|jgi:HK97 family phage portal protein|nr:phage portal protein [SAR202 cluster bacterium]
MGLRKSFAGWIYPEQAQGRERANPVGNVISTPLERIAGVGEDWAQESYGEQMAQSVPVYSAVRLLASSVSSVPPKVFRRDVQGGRERRVWVGPDHPAQALLDRVNPHMTRGDLWTAVETYLDLWGSAFLAVERNDAGRPFEIWPLRPDRVKVIPHPEQHVSGYLYTGRSGEQVALATDEVIPLRLFNPLDEYAGLSPIAPLLQSIKMGRAALKASLSALENDGTPGLVIETDDTPTEEEVKEFYLRWDDRFRGPANRRRPAILGASMRASDIGMSMKDLEFLETLRWAIEDTARVYAIPKMLLGDLRDATYSNFQVGRRVYWESAVMPRLKFYQEALQECLLPLFGDRSLVVEFDVSSIEALQEDETERAKRWAILVKSGIMTQDEARAMLGLAPLGGQAASL